MIIELFGEELLSSLRARGSNGMPCIIDNTPGDGGDSAPEVMHSFRKTPEVFKLKDEAKGFGRDVQ